MRLKQTLASIAAALLLASFAYAGDTSKIDPVHTSISFSVRHMGINHVKGQLKEFAGAIVLEKGKITEASGTIQVKGVDSGVQERDDHLRSPEFFDAAKTKRIEMSGEQIILVADFTMHGVTKELRLPAKLTGPTKDPWGSMRIGLEASAKLNRNDYGINYHEVLESGIPAVGDEIEIEINAEATRPAAK